VKICGIQTVEEALATQEAGADMLGLMFVPTSKRLVSLKDACSISAAIRDTRASHTPSQPQSQVVAQFKDEPWFTTHARQLSSTIASTSSRPLLVGVFQNQPLQYVLDVVATAQLDIVQLHGSEPLQWSTFIPVPVIRVFHVGKGKGVEGITRNGLHQFVLLDSMREGDGLSGGSGKIVDWETARQVVEAGEVFSGPISVDVHATKEGGDQTTNGDASATVNGQANASRPSPFALPIILAGGLTVENVRQAIDAVHPWAVDVSGGVENAEKTGKDLQKVSAFIAAAKEYKA